MLERVEQVAVERIGFVEEDDGLGVVRGGEHGGKRGGARRESVPHADDGGRCSDEARVVWARAVWGGEVLEGLNGLRAGRRRAAALADAPHDGRQLPDHGGKPDDRQFLDRKALRFPKISLTGCPYCPSATW